MSSTFRVVVFANSPFRFYQEQQSSACTRVLLHVESKMHVQSDMHIQISSALLATLRGFEGVAVCNVVQHPSLCHSRSQH